MTFGGRVRAAMAQRALETTSRAAPILQDRWRKHHAGRGIPTPDRQVFYQWLGADEPRITPENLFHLADALDVSARWLAIKEGSIAKPITPDPELQLLLDAWLALKSPEAREQLQRDASKLLAIQGGTSAAYPLKTVKNR